MGKVLHIYGKSKALHHCGNYCTSHTLQIHLLAISAPHLYAGFNALEVFQHGWVLGTAASRERASKYFYNCRVGVVILSLEMAFTPPDIPILIFPLNRIFGATETALCKWGSYVNLGIGKVMWLSKSSQILMLVALSFSELHWRCPSNWR